jgi:citrate synthase
MSENVWKTAITDVKPDELRLRGYLVSDLMGARSFAETAWLALTGDLPEPDLRPLIEALFSCSVDHGITPPSALAARIATSTGASMSQAIASGVLAINAYHGGAVEGCMLTLDRGISLQHERHLDADEAAAVLLEDLRRQNQRMPGFGHRLHRSDPRTTKLRDLAHQGGVYGHHLNLADAIERRFTVMGKELPLNVDGAIAAVLCELKVDPSIGNGFFVIARTVGLVAHFAEERTRERPMRRIDQRTADYDGFPPRDLPRGGE